MKRAFSYTVVALSAFAIVSCTGATRSDKVPAELTSEEACCVDSSAMPTAEADFLTVPSYVFDVVQNIFADSTSLRRHLAPLVGQAGDATMKELGNLAFNPLEGLSFPENTWTPDEVTATYSRLAWLRNSGKMSDYALARGDSAVYLVTFSEDRDDNVIYGGVFTVKRDGKDFRVTELSINLPDSLYPSGPEYMAAGNPKLSEASAFLKNYESSSAFRRAHSADKVCGFYFRDYYRICPERIIPSDMDDYAYSWDMDTLESCVRQFQAEMTGPSRFESFTVSPARLYYYLQPEGRAGAPSLVVGFRKFGDTWKAVRADCNDDSDNYTVI